MKKLLLGEYLLKYRTLTPSTLISLLVSTGKLSVPLALSVMPVSGYTRLIVHYSLLSFNETIEQSGFAHIRSADNGEDVCHDVILRC